MAGQFMQPEARCHPQNFLAHLEFRVLLLAVIIPHASFEPDERQPAKSCQMTINIDASARVFDFVARCRQHRRGVVIAIDVVEGDIEGRNQKF